MQPLVVCMCLFLVVFFLYILVLKLQSYESFNCNEKNVRIFGVMLCDEKQTFVSFFGLKDLCLIVGTVTCVFWL